MTRSPYPCTCTPRHLRDAGCTCGAWAAEQADKEARARVEAFEARERLRELENFLIGEPTPPVTFRALCLRCQHLQHGMNHCDDEQGCNCTG